MKTITKSYPLMHPSTIVLVGTLVNDLPNFTTIGDVAVAGLNPALMMISLNENHQATKYIMEHGKMSINFPGPNLLSEVDFAGMFSAKTHDKSQLVKCSFEDELPVVDEASVTLLVRVLDHIQIKQRVIFVTEVYRTLVEEDLIKEGKLDLSDVQPILYGPDNQYYSGIQPIGTGYLEGRKLMNNDQESTTED